MKRIERKSGAVIHSLVVALPPTGKRQTYYAIGCDPEDAAIYHGIGRDAARGSVALDGPESIVDAVKALCTPSPSYAAAVSKARRAGTFEGLI